MRPVYAALLILPLVLSNLALATPPPSAAEIQRTIDSYVPIWSPPRGEFAGWTIALDAGDNAQLGTPARLDDDLSLLTVSHLYHLIRLAGGGVVLLRADDTLRPGATCADPTRRFDTCRGRSDVYVAIQYAAQLPSASVGDLGSRAPDTELAAALRTALHAAAQPANATLFGDMTAVASAAPAVTGVVLPRPAETTIINADARRACYEDARRLYAGLRAYCAQSTVHATPPSEAAGDAPNIRGTATSAGRMLWPEGPLPASQIDWFCHAYARTFITNRSLVYFDVSADTSNGVVLRGATSVPRIVSGLESALRDVGIDNVRSEVRALPDREQLGEQLFGVCRAPMALLYIGPQNTAGRQTQMLFGEPLFLLDRRDGDYLLHVSDGYWGWVAEAAVHPMTATQFDAYMQRPTAIVLRDITTQGAYVPRSAVVRLADAPPTAPQILLPDGTTLAVPPDAVKIETSDDRVAQRVAAALELLYTPYVFGGRSPLGLDCSGLVLSAAVRDGDAPARDVWHQAFAGRLVATASHRTNIRAGDQLFFIQRSGKLFHTALALDATHFVHSSPPCVQINSLDPRDPLFETEYDETFFMAKRP